MRILICGSRTWSDPGPIARVLDGYQAVGAVTVIEGGANGADQFAESWARLAWQVEHEQYPADWNQYGRAAGPIRNQQMLDEGKPDVVWAFVDKPLIDSRGTCDMVGRAEDAGIPTYIVEAQ